MNAQVISSGGEKSTLFSPLSVFGSPSRIDDENGADLEGKMKTRLMSMWNNVKFGMKLKTNFSKESPVWLLGRCYHKRENPDLTELGTDVAALNSQGNLAANDDEGFDGFKSDFMSRFWMTYRREFPILNGSTYSSDCGWGCMLRSGQMLLAQALVCHFLGRAWRWNPNCKDEKEHTHRLITKWFGDKRSINSPISIHSLVSLGESSGKKAGDWYGPGAVAHILKKAVKHATKDNCQFDSLTVCVAQDCAVYIKDVMQECCENGKWKKSLILLIPLRLGAEKFNPLYAPYLTALLSLEECIGIIGGRPKHSLYFVGYQDDKLIHLDPHYCQEMVDVWADQFPLTSFHCRSPRKLHISKMDPSCCIGFYCKTENDFHKLIVNVMNTVVESNGVEYPMFVFCDGHSSDSRVSPRHMLPPDLEYSTEDADYAESEEFELL